MSGGAPSTAGVWSCRLWRPPVGSTKGPMHTCGTIGDAAENVLSASYWFRLRYPLASLVLFCTRVSHSDKCATRIVCH